MNETQADQASQPQPRTAPPSKRSANWPLILLVIIALVLLTGGHHRIMAWFGYTPGPSQFAGKAAPKFTATTLGGEQISFPGDYAGKLVLLKFWATWCGPCVAELPKLAEVHEKFSGDDFAVLAVNLDGGRAEQVKKWLSDKGYGWTQIHERADVIAGQYGVRAIPASFLIDGDTGEIVAAEDQLSGPYLQQTIQQALAAQAE